MQVNFDLVYREETGRLAQTLKSLRLIFNVFTNYRRNKMSPL